MELVKPVEPVLWASIVELVIGGTGYGTVEALLIISVLHICTAHLYCNVWITRMCLDFREIQVTSQ